MTAALIFFQDDIKITRKFSDSVFLKEFYKDLVKEKVSPIFVVDCLKPSKIPEGHKIAAGHRWCPYCASDRKFILNQVLDTHRCEICEVSEIEQYVRQLNGDN